jgi:hypothetical protein
MSEILDVPFALRRLLRNTLFHASKETIPMTELTPDKEPDIRQHIRALATKITEDPDYLLQALYGAEERAKDWTALVKKQVLDASGNIIPIDNRSRPGHKILDHHMLHFCDVANHAGVSLRSLVTQERLETAILRNISMHSSPYRSEIRRMLAITGGVGMITKYRAVTAKAIVQYYGNSGGVTRVLDPCIGWGGRMLGSLAASPTTVYVGCEPDPRTADRLVDILATTDGVHGPHGVPRATVIPEPAEVALPGLAVAATAQFDIVLTSPPYFNLELYGDDPHQSTATHSTWDDWVTGWLTPVIHGSLACLKPPGVSCWSVKDFRSDRLYPLAAVTRKIHEEAGWRLVKTVTMSGSGRPGGARIKAGKETRGSEEETFCFKRTEEV